MLKPTMPVASSNVVLTSSDWAIQALLDGKHMGGGSTTHHSTLIPHNSPGNPAAVHSIPTHAAAETMLICNIPMGFGAAQDEEEDDESEGDDSDDDDDNDGEPKKNLSKGDIIKGASLKLLLGIAICAVISDPMVDAVSNFSKVRHHCCDLMVDAVSEFSKVRHHCRHL